VPIERLLDAVQRRRDIRRRVAALVLPISNRPSMTSSCAGKVGLGEPGEHTSGPNLASRDNVAHIGILNDSRIVGTLSVPLRIGRHVVWGRHPETCRAPAVPNGGCRMHGEPSPGAPKGNKNLFMIPYTQKPSRGAATFQGGCAPAWNRGQAVRFGGVGCLISNPISKISLLKKSSRDEAAQPPSFLIELAPRVCSGGHSSGCDFRKWCSTCKSLTT
jgi:hypothetical protein